MGYDQPGIGIIGAYEGVQESITWTVKVSGSSISVPEPGTILGLLGVSLFGLIGYSKRRNL